VGSSLFHFFRDWNLFIAMPDEASVFQEDFSEWHVGSVPVHVRAGDAFVAKFLFQGRLCFFRLPCPVTIHRWKSNCRIRVRITKEVAREILAQNCRQLVPLSTEWDVRIEVPCFLRNYWVPINAPESQPEPQPFVPQPTDVKVPLHPGSGNAVAREPLRPPVEHLSLERPQPESQVTVPWDLERLARHTDSQLGVSPSSDRRPPPEEEDSPVVFSPLFQRNSNPEVASAMASPVQLLPQWYQDSDDGSGESGKVDMEKKDDDNILGRVELEKKDVSDDDPVRNNSELWHLTQEHTYTVHSKRVYNL
jgi:hypothetical protein